MNPGFGGLGTDQEVFQTVIGGTADAVFLKDAEGRYLMINPAGCRISGLDEEGILGRTDGELFEAPVAHVMTEHDRLVIQSGRPFVFEERIPVPGGERIYHISRSPYRDKAGKVVGLIGVGRDISERKRSEEVLEQSEERARVLIEGVRDYAIFMLDPEGIVITWNSGARTTTGYQTSEIVGRSFEVFFPPSAAQAGEPGRLLGAARNQGQIETEGFRLRRGGANFWANHVLTALRSSDGGLRGFSSIMKDSTERKRAEAALREVSLREQAALEASRLKSEFLANMSHEIRTTMNGVLGMSSLLLDTQLSPQQRDYIGIVKNSAESLLGIIDDILDFSKIEAGKLAIHARDVDLFQLIEETLKSFSLAAERKGLQLVSRLDPAVPREVQADPTRLRQVLVNLLGNALKFTERGSVTLEAFLDPAPEPGSLQLRFKVRDTGIGISPESMSRIFQPFSQVESASNRRYGGTGLGLSICKRIVELMGGALGVESRAGEGSEFWFTIQLNAGRRPVDPVQSKGPSESAAPSGSSLMRILIAEDNPVNQMVMLRMLERLGYSADSVATGQEVLDALGRAHYDLILMDCQMPGMDGYEATRRIRARSGPESMMPVVALTANAMIGSREKCLEAGMNDFATKPVILDSLRELLERWIPRSVIDDADLDRLRKLEVGSGDAVVGEMIGIFLASASARLSRIRKGLLECNGAGVAAEAHGLRSAALALGARDWGQWLSKLEIAGSEGRLQEARDCFARLERDFPRVEFQLRRIASGGS